MVSQAAGDGLLQTDSGDDNAVTWLIRDVATSALAK